MNQKSLFEIELVDPDDVVSEETRLARMTAYDAWHETYLRRFWNARRAVIAASGDTVRMKLLAEHDRREAEKQERAA